MRRLRLAVEVVLTGFDVENTSSNIIRLNKLSLANEKLIKAQMSRFEDHELIILETGRMGGPINLVADVVAVTVMWKSNWGLGLRRLA